jgi:hypothetical protein
MLSFGSAAGGACPKAAATPLPVCELITARERSEACHCVHPLGIEMDQLGAHSFSQLWHPMSRVCERGTRVGRKSIRRTVMSSE